MKLTGSHWAKGADAGVVTAETDETVTLTMDSGQTKGMTRNELIGGWVRVTSPAEANRTA